jgi:hypothetical protein
MLKLSAVQRSGPGSKRASPYVDLAFRKLAVTE